jgi:hypothetical protein
LNICNSINLYLWLINAYQLFCSHFPNCSEPHIKWPACSPDTQKRGRQIEFKLHREIAETNGWNGRVQPTAVVLQEKERSTWAERANLLNHLMTDWSSLLSLTRQ